MWIITSGAWLRGLVAFAFFVCFVIRCSTRRFPHSLLSMGFPKAISGKIGRPESSNVSADTVQTQKFSVEFDLWLNLLILLVSPAGFEPTTP
jgi:hypothetical protein